MQHEEYNIKFQRLDFIIVQGPGDFFINTKVNSSS